MSARHLTAPLGLLLALVLGACQGPPSGFIDLELDPDAAADPDGAPVIDAAPPPDVHYLPDAGLGLIANLRPIAHHTQTSLEFDIRSFAFDSCEVQEACTLPGKRHLLRFDTLVENAGAVDLVLGAPPGVGISDDDFEWSACHLHHHFRGYAIYELLDAGGEVVRVGKAPLLTSRKQAFCLTDSVKVGDSWKTAATPRCTGTEPPGTPCLYNCAYQGASAGWADLYGRALACQWVDVCGVPPGNYQLRIRVNPEGLLAESPTDDNDVVIPVTVPALVDPTVCAD
jgi:hypothetical protein